MYKCTSVIIMVVSIHINIMKEPTVISKIILAKVNNLHRKKAVGKWSADSLPTTYRLLTDSLPTTYRPLEKSILDIQVRP
jgi:hypothetical protein